MTSNNDNDNQGSNTGQELKLRIPLVKNDDNDALTGGSASSTATAVPSASLMEIQSFRMDGFCVFPNVLSQNAVDALNDRLEEVLRGTYDRGNKPDKAPRKLKSNKPTTTTTTAKKDEEKAETLNNISGSDKTKQKKKKNSGIGPIGFSGNFQNVKVLQIINIHKADSLFRKLETNRQLCNIVAQLAGWEQGARLAQDQVWAKPPGAPPLVFHRDSPYFMFEPSQVVTVWLALDDMDDELGPLEFVKSSHKWGDGRVGSASHFFQANNPKNLLQSAAELEGLNLADLEIVSMAGLKAGGLSIHDGKVWHGSSKNASQTRPRRGLGMHFVPANVRFTADANRSSLWKPYVADAEDPSKVELSEEDFPKSSW